MERSYSDKLEREVEIYAGDANVHDLPPIYHLWSTEFIEPKLVDLGVASHAEFFLEPIETIARRSTGVVRVVSIGSGNGDLEISLARALHGRGLGHVRFTLVEINESMQRRAIDAARVCGVSSMIETEVADFNTWRPSRPFDVAIASHSLHHVVELEHLFQQIHDGLSDSGVFIVSDMIGRNGHARWPEAADFVRRLWTTLPSRYKFNHQLQEQHDSFPDWDCSSESFEGVRAQDVLPTLLATFHPGLFFAFANVSDVFVDRSYGPNFDPNSSDDAAWIRRVGELDDLLLDLGLITPTHLMATFHKHIVPLRAHGQRTPSRCVRSSNIVDLSGQAVVQPQMAGQASVSLDGAALPLGRLHGVFEDRWAGPLAHIDAVAATDLTELQVGGFVPETELPRQTIRLHVDDVDAGSRTVAGAFEVRFPLSLHRGQTFHLRLDASSHFSVGDSESGGDRRSLSFVLNSLRCR